MAELWFIIIEVEQLAVLLEVGLSYDSSAENKPDPTRITPQSSPPPIETNT